MVHVMASIEVEPEHAGAVRVEAWRAQADADAHMKTAHVAAAIAGAGPLLAVPLDVVTSVRFG
jgi:quinol monooxygenase YgiN